MKYETFNKGDLFLAEDYAHPKQLTSHALAGAISKINAALYKAFAEKNPSWTMYH